VLFAEWVVATTPHERVYARLLVPPFKWNLQPLYRYHAAPGIPGGCCSINMGGRDIKRASGGARVVALDQGFPCLCSLHALSGGRAYVRVHGRPHLSWSRALMLRTKNAYKVPLSECVPRMGTKNAYRWDYFLRPLRASACSRGGRHCASR
jgi:hypothetical protein